MKCYDFEFDGSLLSDKGFIICKFGSEGIETVSNGSYITFNTISTMKGTKHELTSSEYSDCLTTTIQICKHPCFSNSEVVSIEEQREIMKWLNRKEFHKFKPIDAEYIDIFFEASFNVRKIESNGKVYGFELEMITNRPYALQEPVLIYLKNIVPYGKKRVYIKSDDEGYIYPDMEITITQDGDFELCNSFENRTMRIVNCKAGEVIRVQYPIIESSVTDHKIQNDFNWKFFRIVNTLKEKANDITISIPCTIKMIYSPIVKVGI